MLIYWEMHHQELFCSGCILGFSFFFYKQVVQDLTLVQHESLHL